MLTGAQPKFETYVIDGNLILDEPVKNWKLVRERDGLTRISKKVAWIEWQEDGKFRQKYGKIGIGRSLLMSPFNDFFTWMTTEVTEIIEGTEDFLRFKTKNSVYTLTKI